MNHAEPILFQSIPLLILIVSIVAAGAVVQAGLGMGFGLTVAPLLALLDPALVPGPTLYVGLLSAILVMSKEIDQVNWREVKIGAVGRVIGVAIGALILSQLADIKTFMLVFGLLIAGAVVLSALGWKLAATIPNLLSMSSISGLMGIITSVRQGMQQAECHATAPSPPVANQVLKARIQPQKTPPMLGALHQQADGRK